MSSVSVSSILVIFKAQIFRKFLIIAVLIFCGQFPRISAMFSDIHKFQSVWGYSSTSELFRWPEWWEEHTTSGQGSFRERSPVCSRFSELLFLEVPATATEQVHTCGCRRNSSSFDRAPKIRDSVRLNSFESFLVTLPSIPSETWEMYSWANSGSSVFCDRLFLVFSGVSLETAANFLLFPNVAKILREKFCQWWRLNWSFIFYNKSVDLLLLWGKCFNENKTVNDFNKRYNTRRLQFI